MKTSLIITTYNSPKTLRLVLSSVVMQSVQPDDVIIADDGSTEDTGIVIKRFSYLLNITHSWQMDKGFRVARSRNKALLKAKGDYIVIVDGDMVLHQHFIRDHLRIAKKGFFTQGSRVIVDEETTNKALTTMKIKFPFFNKNIKNKANGLSIPLVSFLISRLSSRKKTESVRSCNMAFWRCDVVHINGFNNRFEGWGREDSEFIIRMINSGIKRQNLKFGGIAYHLYHQENSKASLAKNDELLYNAIQYGITACDDGLNECND